jgi:hypothetical protein
MLTMNVANRARLALNIYPFALTAAPLGQPFPILGRATSATCQDLRGRSHRGNAQVSGSEEGWDGRATRPFQRRRRAPERQAPKDAPGSARNRLAACRRRPEPVIRLMKHCATDPRQHSIGDRRVQMCL